MKDTDIRARRNLLLDMKRLLLKSDNKYVRRVAISVIESLCDIEYIDLGSETYLRMCK